MPAKAGIQYSPQIALQPQGRDYWIIRLRG
jgi:hypothetical protein